MFCDRSSGVNRGKHGRRQFAFHALQILRRTLERLRSDVIAIAGSVDLHRHLEMSVCVSQASLDYGIGIHLPADLAYVQILVLELKSGGARHYAQVWNMSK